MSTCRALAHAPEHRTLVLRDRASAQRWAADLSFRSSDATRYGVELEWIVQHDGDPTRRIDTRTLRRALGRVAPATIARGRRAPAGLGAGSAVSVEPGGQVEISTAPQGSIAALLRAARRDADELGRLLGRSGLVRGDAALDGIRPARRALRTPRYRAMQAAFDRIGAAGSRMMCSTAAIHVCVDAGAADRIPARWDALHGLGPVMIALFANSPTVDENGVFAASGRMRAVLDTDPARSRPLPPTSDPVAAWAAHAVETPLLCVRRPGREWSAPPGVSFADWIEGAMAPPPTVDDLEYHLSTLFPPVRAHGYLEARYLDAQPGTGWITPTAMLLAFMEHEDTVDAVVALTRPVVGREDEAARRGLADDSIRAVADRVLTLAGRALERVDLPADLRAEVNAGLRTRRAVVVETGAPR